MQASLLLEQRQLLDTVRQLGMTTLQSTGETAIPAAYLVGIAYGTVADVAVVLRRGIKTLGPTV